MKSSKSTRNSLAQRSEARIAAVKCLYMQLNSDTPKSPQRAINDILSYYQENPEENDHSTPPNQAFLTSLVEGVITNQDELNQTIIPLLSEEWKMERLSPIIQSILRTAVYELYYKRDIPFKVILNEYINITRSFFDEQDVKFVNGILDNITKQARGDERV